MNIYAGRFVSTCRLVVGLGLLVVVAIWLSVVVGNLVRLVRP